MGFWSGYWASLKSKEVEEPVDVWVHRPVGYVIAKLALPTPVSPDQITVASIALGLASGLAFALPFPHHLQVGAVCLFLSAAFDCADGMLARMRRSSSAFGRMLDGIADLVSIAAAVLGSLVVLVMLYRSSPWHIALAVACTALTVFTSSFHTSGYDHYKNVYMRLTLPGSREGDDVEAAILRFEEACRQPMGLVRRITWKIYLDYLKSQRDFIARFDPFTSTALDALPGYDPARAAIYRKHAGPAMRLWRTFFGTGSLIFGLAIFDAFGRPDVFLALRLVLLNGIFVLYLRPLQRRASQRAFVELGLAKGPGKEVALA